MRLAGGLQRRLAPGCPPAARPAGFASHPLRPPAPAAPLRGRPAPPAVRRARRAAAAPPARAALAQPPAPAPAAALPRGEHWEVHKFGGTCVAAAERIDAVARFLVGEAAAAPAGGRRLAVVSAMGSHPTSPVKVTDLLINCVARAERRDVGFADDLAALLGKHEAAAAALLGAGSPEEAAFVGGLRADAANLSSMLQAISIAGMSTQAFEEFVVGHGELWCAALTAARCRQLAAERGGAGGAPLRVAMMDARDALVVSPTADGGSVDVEYELSNAALDAWWASERGGGARAPGAPGPALVVATGFIAKNARGQVTTLKRNGSDYSATILGALLGAGRITIWTDVDGVFSADPRKVPDAVCLPWLSYNEAWELSYFGAAVLHPRTTLPAMRAGVPVAIRNFFNRDGSAGTVIAGRPDASVDADAEVGVKGFATIDDVSLVEVEGTGMVGVPGTAAAIFSTMRDANVNVIMISQASSEHSVCFAVKSADTEPALAALRRRFGEAIAAGRISCVGATEQLCVLAMVGEGMASRRGVAASMFGALAKANVNIRAIAQGSSEYNITAVIAQADAKRALRAVHARFFSRAALPLGVGLVGPGLIGSTLLDQLRDQAAELAERYHVDVRLLGIASSSRMVLADDGAPGLPLDAWRDAWADASAAQPVDYAAFAARLARHPAAANAVVVDCSAADAPPAHYLDWMRAGLHVVTPNKKMNSGPLERYAALRAHQRESYIHYFYEGTVGAGLPVLQTLQHLVASGDRVDRVEGVFSGTLSYIFNTWRDAGMPFSDVVRQAKAAGYTEPDPRDDLAGADVARKVTILAREAGLMLEMADVPVRSLVPPALAACGSADEYLARLPEGDAEMAELLAEAAAAGEVLRYVGVVDVAARRGSVELRRYPADHAFASLSGADNIIAFTTARYAAQPLIVRGPGAGAEVTAGGVFSDLLRLAAYLGAPS